MPSIKFDEWTLGVSEGNWIIYRMRVPKKESHRRSEENKGKPPEPYRDIKGYYHRLSAALTALLDLILKDSEATTLEEFAKDFQRAHNKILKIGDVHLR